MVFTFLQVTSFQGSEGERFFLMLTQDLLPITFFQDPFSQH